ncbi:uncharacterized protein LOC133660681 [Entelurus aequoreus]|uniref:uncharacterized protein LOC133660136 n=1 Tax=Entelurus aequoreus TaxID=161455 RepID=UPI002B1D60DF|nr:uncharacterized protein LOC133660136 [Entelurus aequoreus]XP_061920241.1 uncharacterized protein LOC133660681 [Entelurus aequoreus]
MEDNHHMVFFLLAMWLHITRRRQALFESRLQAARRNTAEKMRRLLDLMEEETFTRKRKRRKRMLPMLLKSRRRPSIWAVRRSNEWWDQVVPGFTRTDWVHHFRMSEETFLHICAELRPAMQKRDTNFRVCVPVKKRVAIALWKLATNSEFKSISHLFGVSKTTVCRCVREFCSAACALLLPQQIRFPNADELREMAAGVEQSWGLPRCIGAIDAAHIPIIAPTERHGDYVNEGGWHSIILQGVVDGRGRFWSACVGTAGSLDEEEALRMSSLWQVAEQGTFSPPCARNGAGVTAGYYILGDAAYPSKSWLLRPFLDDDGQLTAAQQTYNEKVCKAQTMATGAFSRLRGRWRCLTKRNDSDIEVVKSMVLTCCALHNLCERREEEYRQEWDAHVTAPAPARTPASDDEEEGEDVRVALMRFFSNAPL